MKWINEKTVQGDPMDTKNYFIPKEEYNIPLVNEGIQEGRKLVFCKDCKQWDAELGCCTSYTIVKCTDGREGVESKADDFCSRGELK